MATYREMQDRITGDYLNRTDMGAQAKQAIIRAVKHYEVNALWFNQTATAIAIGTASATVAVPADFLILDFATVTNASVESVLTIRSYDRIAYRNATGASGVPVEIAYYKDALYFTPKPASATSLTLYYTHSLPALSADTDSNGWTSAGEDLIVHRATADLLGNVLRVTDVAQVQAHKAWEQEALSNLQLGASKRMQQNKDAVTIGRRHGQQPKVPSNNMS